MNQRHTMTTDLRALVKCAVAQCFTFGPDRRQMTPALARLSYEAEGPAIPADVWTRLTADGLIERRDGRLRLTDAGAARVASALEIR